MATQNATDPIEKRLAAVDGDETKTNSVGAGFAASRKQRLEREKKPRNRADFLRHEPG